MSASDPVRLACFKGSSPADEDVASTWHANIMTLYYRGADAGYLRRPVPARPVPVRREGSPTRVVSGDAGSGEGSWVLLGKLFLKSVVT